jgi:Tol biopolymer transport system component
MVSLLVLTFAVLPLLAQQREPVLKQIDLPHPYYYREMYLPQLTTGASSVAWTSDSRALIYSMGGSLWRQDLKSTIADQLTDGPGYHYQPDCSPDGRWVVYSAYQKNAIELLALDLTTKHSRQLTSGGAVNVEPRFSPDGKRIAFVSTSFHGHFHIFVGDFSEGKLTNITRLTGETRSTLPRYYYSAFDHEISPVWSPDGQEILFVSNRDHIYGTGGFWRMKAQPGAEAHEIHYEETTWKARPDFSPDGKRLVYASYQGQQWHQLWVMPSNGGDALPLSYGDFDNINPRWSPDGKKIAFISNRGGNTSLWTQDIPGGAQAEVFAKTKRYLNPTARLKITVTDSAGRPTPSRIFIAGFDGRAYAPADAWMQADDSLVPSEQPFESHYFESSGTADLTMPAGEITVTVMKGFEYQPETRKILISANQSNGLKITLQPLRPFDDSTQWFSGDVHVHMNYGGTYRNTPKHLVEQAQAENLNIVENLIVNKEQRIPDIAYFRTDKDPASTSTTLLFHSQEFHTSYWGHLGLLNLKHNFLIPGYSAYTGTAAASLSPTNADVADLAHAQNGVVGYVHPFDAFPDPFKDPTMTDELPVDVALGKVDYIEVLGFSDHKSTAEIWYKLLNCGFHLPTAAGTDAMENFASLRGPLGLNRVYVQTNKSSLDYDGWLKSLKNGNTFATNGPLLRFKLADQIVGGELKRPAGENKVEFSASLRSIVPVDHLQIVCNGQVARELELSGNHQIADVTGTIPISRSGWCLLRAWSEKPESPILDTYPYATTSPIYITVKGSAVRAPEDARFFTAWIDRLIPNASENKDWNNEMEKASVLDQLNKARSIYSAMQH